MGSELKNCPFCGGSAVWNDTGNKPCFVICKCGAIGPDARSGEEAIAAWNTRPDAPAPEGVSREALEPAVTAAIPELCRQLVKWADDYEPTSELARLLFDAERCIVLLKDTLDRNAIVAGESAL